MKLFEVKSNIILQNPNSKSLRTTIPAEIVGILELHKDDKMVWVVNTDDGEIIVEIKKEYVATIFFSKNKFKLLIALAKYCNLRFPSATI